ncbi:hypothetical protein BDV37DRAFT_242876 [Aspergillus pseudonomiae]|uniref:Uncharacterized protein n=1 Tax=Aspergillus pseudonomiae TaxID=1506151 RepID=A0A5N7DJI0_9EURO|nr:uncharacterized protein BDV37DRAFT_242876 [Aspergillus pseudonomiae]KAE8406606.1 hypothetical protein BDV37DRAFT_242876 [Aspergillus pseudonomiae]
MTSNMNPNRKRHNTVAEREGLIPRKKESSEKVPDEKSLNEDNLPLVFKRARDNHRNGRVEKLPCMRLRRFCCRCKKEEGVRSDWGRCRACGHESCPECLA